MTIMDTELNYKDINDLPDELLIHIFKYLSLYDILCCEKVCSRWMVLARDSTVWRNIDVSFDGRLNISNIPEENLDIIASHAEFIRWLKLLSVGNYNNIEALMNVCIHLESIELIMCRIKQKFVSYITKWPKLKKINIKNCYICTESENDLDFSIQFDHFKDLSYLGLSDFGLSSTNCYALLQCQYLSHILIDKIKGLQIKFIKDLVLKQQNILVTFHIYGGDAIDDDCLQLISQCPRLQDLAIVRCENLTDKGLLTLPNIRRIKHMQIWNNNNFSEKALLVTLGSPIMINLQRLSFSKILNASPVVVDLISEHYKNLKFLALYQCPKIIYTDYQKQLKSKFRNIDVFLY